MKKFHHKKITHPSNKLLPLRKRLNKDNFLNRFDKIAGRALNRYMDKQEAQKNGGISSA